MLLMTYKKALSFIKLRYTLVPKLQRNPVAEALASQDGKLELPIPNSQAGAWELAFNIATGVQALLVHAGGACTPVVNSFPI